MRSIVHVVALAIGLMMVGQAALAENRVALVIGQSAYRTVPPLPNPANDAKVMAELLGSAGFEVTTASDVSQSEMRKAIGDFADTLTAKGPDTVALIYYAGHGLQVDGENFLLPVDVSALHEADIPLQGVRLNDLLNALGSVPSKIRIIMLDACRDNPFPALEKEVGRGLALVDTKAGAAGTFISFSTSPGAVAEDGSGVNSPYTSALLIAARERGLTLEQALKRVRLAVNKSTDGRQTPWDSSSLTTDFYFFPGPGDAKASQVKGQRTVQDWRRELAALRPEAAYDAVVAEDSVEAYDAFVALFAQPPFGQRVRLLLDRRREMVAWNIATTLNTTASLQLFLTNYPKSDFAATARRLLERLRNRPQPGGLAATAVALATPVATGPMCPCVVPPPTKAKSSPPKSDDPAPKKVYIPPQKQVDTSPKPPPTRVVVVKPPITTTRPPPTRPTRQPQGGGVDLGTVIGIGGLIAGALAGGHHGGGGGGGPPRGGCYMQRR
jgi:Caspase domain